MRFILIFFHLKYKGDWDKIFKALEAKEPVSLKDKEEVEAKYGDQYITLIDRLYPSVLKEVFKPPFVITFKEGEKIINEMAKVETEEQALDLIAKYHNFKIEKQDPNFTKHQNETTNPNPNYLN